MTHPLTVPPPSSIVSGATPWKRSWFYCAPREWTTFGYLALIHGLTVAGLILLPLPPWQALVIAGVLCILGGLGTTVAYHRALAHKSLTLHPLARGPLVFLAMFNGSGSPLSWVANHRHHHAHSDTDRDISSPHYGGFWWSHLRWLWQAGSVDVPKHCRDMDLVAWGRWSHLQIPMLALSLAGGLLTMLWLDWQTALAVCLWAGPIRLVFALHVQCTVNSVCHMGPIAAEHGSARNIWWLAFAHMGQGENWHSNHHARPSDPQLGKRWWQVDMGWWVIIALERLGLASNIRRLPSRGESPAR